MPIRNVFIFTLRKQICQIDLPLARLGETVAGYYLAVINITIMLKYLKIRYFDYNRQGAGHKVKMLGYQSPHILKVFGHKV